MNLSPLHHPGRTLRPCSEYSGNRFGLPGVQRLKLVRESLDHQLVEKVVAHPYEEQAGGLVWRKPAEGGSTPRQLTNFTARILKEIVRDDGLETHRLFEIEAKLNGKVATFTITAERFVGLQWAVEHLGIKAIVNAGNTNRDHARAAIQYLSRNPEQHTVYTHTGWRKIGDRWIYLHAAGGIGVDGGVHDLVVDLLGDLSGICLPDPPLGNERAEAVRASLALLNVAPDYISIPILSATYRAVLGQSNFGFHLTGQTGVFKTELAALSQRHYGKGMDAEHLPGSWSSTANSLEAQAFYVKDAIFVVDDFVPGGSENDAARDHRKADRLLRAQGNVSGRARMASDGTLRATRRPRGLVISTGEEIPGGQSLRARTLVLDIGPDDVGEDVLTACQGDAAAGKYAASMAAYVQSLAPRIEEIQQELPKAIQSFRSGLDARAHRRTSTIEAELLIGFEYFLSFAVEVGAISGEERRELWSRARCAIAEIAARQRVHQRDAEPTERFRELLRSALASGLAHVSGPDGNKPDHPSAWGYDHTVNPPGRGIRIGWLTGEGLYLDEDASFRAAQDAARGSHDRLSVGAKTLGKRLKEKGYLVSTEGGRNTTRATLEGERRRVLHVRRSFIYPDSNPHGDEAENAG